MLTKPAKFFILGGTLPPDSASYVERRADRELLENLTEGNYCFVLNSRQMGKSSLCVRTVSKLEGRGIHTAFIDLTQFGGRNAQMPQWYTALIVAIGRALGLYEETLAAIKAQSDASPMTRFFEILHTVFLERIHEPIVVFIDEIDATRSLPFDTDEFFAGIRECYNRRVQDPAFQRLTFCLLGVAVPNDLIRNPSTTPFNIGVRIQLEDFSLDELSSLGKALGPEGENLIRRVHYWTSGQPFLTQSLCQATLDEGIRNAKGIDSLVARLFFAPRSVDKNTNLSDVANRVLNDPGEEGESEKFRANVLSKYEKVLRKRRSPGAVIKDEESDRAAVVLKLSGLLRSVGGCLVPRNRIYTKVFNRAWIRANMPGQELARQKQSFRRGVVRGVAIAAGAMVLIVGLASYAWEERSEAIRAEAKLDHDLYVSDMTNMRLFYEIGNSDRMQTVLDRWKTSPHRGFEWHFWLGRLHDSSEEYTLDYSAAGKLEQGVVSMDGRQICIEDRLADEASLVDRRSKQVIRSFRIDSSVVLATDDGIVKFQCIDGPVSVKSVATDKEIFRMGRPGYKVSQVGVPGEFIFAANDPCARTNRLLLMEEGIKNPGDRRLEVYDLAHYQPVYIHTDKLGIDADGLAISQNGRRFVYCEPLSFDRQTHVPIERRLVAWDADTNKAVDSFPFSNQCHLACLSDSGKLLAYIDEHYAAKIRDLDHDKTIYSTVGTSDDIPIAIRIAPDDKTMVWITADGVASVREIPSGRQIAVRTNLWRAIPAGEASTWVGSSSSVRLLNLSSSGQGIIGSAYKLRRDGAGAIRFTLNDSLKVERLSDPTLTVMPPLQIPKNATNMTYNGDWCELVGPKNKQSIIRIDGNHAPIQIPFLLANSSAGVNGDVLIVMDRLSKLYGVSTVDNRVLWSKDIRPPLSGFWISPNSRYLLGTTDAGTILSLDPKTGKELRETAAHKLLITTLSFSADSRTFVTGGGDGQAILWDSATLAKLAVFRGNGSKGVLCADVSPDGRRVVTGNVAGAWQIWDAATGDQLTEIRASSLPLRSVLFTSDGKKLLTSGDDLIVRLWQGLEQDPTVRIPFSRDASRK